jgi:hypothetical protein
MSYCVLSMRFPKTLIPNLMFWDVGTRCRSGLIGFSAKRKRTASSPTHHTHLFRRLNMRNHILLQIQTNEQLAKFTHYDIAQREWSLNFDVVLLWWKQVSLWNNKNLRVITKKNAHRYFGGRFFVLRFAEKVRNVVIKSNVVVFWMESCFKV